MLNFASYKGHLRGIFLFLISNSFQLVEKEPSQMQKITFETAPVLFVKGELYAKAVIFG